VAKSSRWSCPCLGLFLVVPCCNGCIQTLFGNKKEKETKMSQVNLKELSKRITYSDKYCDDIYEYRHVILPREMLPLVPKKTLMTESEWRNLMIVQSHGWEHYMIHEPEPHILLFKREKDYMEKYGNNPRPPKSEAF